MEPTNVTEPGLYAPIVTKPPPVLPSPKRFVLVRSGVRVPFGPDAAVCPHGVNAREFAAYVGYGKSPLETIRTATTNASELLGGDDRGLIAAGKIADLIGVPGSPLEDIKVMEQAAFVMKGGPTADADAARVASQDRPSPISPPCLRGGWPRR